MKEKVFVAHDPFDGKYCSTGESSSMDGGPPRIHHLILTTFGLFPATYTLTQLRYESRPAKSRPPTTTLTVLFNASLICLSLRQQSERRFLRSFGQESSAGTCAAAGK